MLSAHGIAGDAEVGQLLNAQELNVAFPDESCRDIASRLVLLRRERMPVVACHQTMQLVGIISRGDLIKPSLTLFDEDQKREKFRRVRLISRLNARR